MKFEYIDAPPRSRSSRHSEVFDLICRMPEGKALRLVIDSDESLLGLRQAIYKAMRRGRVPAVRMWQSGGALYVARKDMSDE